MNVSSILSLVLATSICVVGCGSSSNAGAGGATSVPTGGAANTGGTSALSSSSSSAAALGGATGSGTTASGGATSAGGTAGVGGSSALVGTTSAGGTIAAGGTKSSAAGGTVATGGAVATGGTTAAVSGGTSSGSGGTKAGGGNTAAGGTKAGGGTPATGGGLPTGGTKAEGGSSSTGTAASGGTSVAGGSTSVCPVVSDFATWPTGDAPLDVGKLAVNNFKSHTGDVYGGAGYALGFTWHGSLLFTKTTGDTTNNKSLIDAFEGYASGKTASPDNAAGSATVDDRAFGVLPFEIYLQNGDTRCLKLGKDRADAQWTDTSGGVPRNIRYWIDDMYMITGLQVMAYRATKDVKYLDRAATTMLDYITQLQQTDGLFWHTKQSKAYWGRANGWVAAGMTELLLELPTGTTRTTIMTAFKKQMDKLLTLQISGGTDDGCWRQVLDLTSASAETSCTAMFTFALTMAAKNGWLTDPSYAAAARKGWLGLAVKTNGSGQMSLVCPGTGQADPGTLASQQAFYANKTLGSDDMHGQAPLLWAANALLRTDCPGVR